VQKVLIISYFFPPCNLTASQRAYSWAKYLSKFGYRPIVLTRRWDHKVNALSDVSKETPAEMLFESNEHYDVYYLPYHASLRDKIYVKFGEQKHLTLRRSLTLMELLFQHFFTFAIPYQNIFHFAEELLRKDPQIKKVIISGNPYVTFKIGYNLFKEFAVKWIADYRDAWSTSEISFTHRPFIFRVINVLDHYFEKKWVSTAAFITASSVPIGKQVTRLTGLKSDAVYNGFIPEDFEGINPAKYEVFTITYVGTLYDGQNIEIFCDAFKRMVDSTPGIRAKLYFPGLAFFKDQAERINKALNGYENYFECTLRMDRSKILEIEKRSHLLLHVAWDAQGVIASKIYEYIASSTFILVTPSDHSSIQQIVEASGCGVCTDTADETFNFLKTEYENYLQGKSRVNDTTQPSVRQFTRENQAKHLAEILDTI
jgi:glycosyltransferase involved in cell wall biosynthesis